MSNKGIQVLAFFGFAFGLVAAEPQYQWRQNDESVALTAGERVVWQLNFKVGENKPFFHPLSTSDGTVLTVSRPADHTWHYGLWFAWKYINGVNYWEEDKKGSSQGMTEVIRVKPETKADHSARVELELSYHPPGKPAILKEKRVIRVSAPDVKGNYFIDWDADFTAGAEELKFDRTPPAKGAGGYAGLSLRFAQGTRGWTFIGSDGATGAKANYGAQLPWIDYHKGQGATVFDHPQNPRHPTPWYPNEGHPFVCAAFVFKEPYTLEAGKSLRLRYRVLIHSEPLTKDDLQQRWAEFSKTGGGE